MAHSHHHHATGRVLGWSLTATVLFVVVEAVAGIKSGSLALLSDAGHNFTDALALALAAIGVYFQSKPANEVKTYGYQRAGVLTAFVNALTLLALSILIFYESYHRLLKPQHVDETVMLWIAGAGLVVNLAIMYALRHGKSDLNVRAAYVHMLGDALGSVGIIAGAIVIRFTGWDRVDPLLSVFIGLLIVWTARDIVRDSLNILLEGLPRGLALQSVINGIQGVDGVIDVHDLHVWSLGSTTHALSCHVLIEDMPPSASDSILRQINRVVCDRFQIHHTTVQFEHVRCALSESGCSIPADTHDHAH